MSYSDQRPFRAASTLLFYPLFKTCVSSTNDLVVCCKERVCEPRVLETVAASYSIPVSILDRKGNDYYSFQHSSLNALSQISGKAGKHLTNELWLSANSVPSGRMRRWLRRSTHFTLFHSFWRKFHPEFRNTESGNRRWKERDSITKHEKLTTQRYCLRNKY